MELWVPCEDRDGTMYKVKMMTLRTHGGLPHNQDNPRSWTGETDGFTFSHSLWLQYTLLHMCLQGSRQCQSQLAKARVWRREGDLTLPARGSGEQDDRLREGESLHHCGSPGEQGWTDLGKGFFLMRIDRSSLKEYSRLKAWSRDISTASGWKQSTWEAR